MNKVPLAGHGELIPFGVCIHSTGSGIPEKATKQNIGILDATISTYKGMAAADGVGPHYAIVPDGTLIQFRAENEVAYHAATSLAERNSYLSGHWDTDNRLAANVVSWWKLRWPNFKSPQHLYPTKSPNFSYIGIELVPCGSHMQNSWTPAFGIPATPVGRYTAQQYQRLAILVTDIGKAWHFPDGWHRSNRLVGHEDVNPITRPGWDPGAMLGHFSWSLLLGMLDILV